jgi:predicted ATP-grasp superfamily ATP-dependent carboligase
MYTGALENRPALVRQLARRRPLWGNDASVLALVRSPRWFADTLAAAGIRCPAVSLAPPEEAGSGKWLVKPLAGAAGAGIAWYTARSGVRERVYYQEYIDGEAGAAVYLGDGRRAHLLGATGQLVGEPWLHAAPFHYCGSLGPLPLTAALRQRLDALGEALVRGSGLRGLFGVDFVIRDDAPRPVEVNPRYSASVEVLEYASRLPALAWHRSVFDVEAPVQLPLTAGPSPQGDEGRDCVGKAILFARAPLTFPADGPWRAALQEEDPIRNMPTFADIPPAGQAIAQGAPILTLFARARSLADCREALRQRAAELDRCLFGR